MASLERAVVYIAICAALLAISAWGLAETARLFRGSPDACRAVDQAPLRAGILEEAAVRAARVAITG
jgi:hypothetical protein